MSEYHDGETNKRASTGRPVNVQLPSGWLADIIVELSDWVRGGRAPTLAEFIYGRAMRHRSTWHYQVVDRSA